ncbi:NAD(P)/FAD-dependent oxidoreductase [Gordonia sp. SL306]|uniref:NAD(P)/FAD-dependent oxidoreductase n=1 Tax=Gordonia sp. SL306 TaxID=2995145 RepID=UPI0022716B4C|nr:FAD-dependent oxidoreductase [Gordonia sp. SL306]WAC54047.1 FAD-dependent oxidoreductase [Gordonia sp. SL306]
MTVHTDVLIVGASAAGLATAEALRRGGFEERIMLIGAESHAPYDRPPLSKQVLSGAWSPDRTRLRPADFIDSLALDIALGETAVSLDAASRTVQTDRRAVTADHVVIATGAKPRGLPQQPELAGLHSFRSLADASALRGDLRDADRLVVVGDGVLGAELAATACGMGVDVTVVGPQAALMESQLGPVVAGLLTELHAAQGVRVRPGTQVVGFADADRRVTGVRSATGDTLPADVVVVAIGAVPATDWLSGSGLHVDDGVVCDRWCRAADGIHAAGDVARIRDATTGTSYRRENRTNATEQGIAVAADILGISAPATPIPYFWSDQFGTKIQVDGSIPRDAEMSVLDGDPAAGRFVASFQRDGVVTGILGWNMPKQSRRHRGRIGIAMSDVEQGVA